MVLIYISLKTNDDYILLCFICHLNIFFSEVSVKTFGPFLYWVIFLTEFWVFFIILDTSSMLDIWCKNIFSQTVACLFIVLTMFFKEEILYFRQEPIYWFFFFDGLCFWCHLRDLNPSSYFLLFSSKSFIILHFIYRYGAFLVYFCKRCGLSSLFFAYDQLFQYF